MPPSQLKQLKSSLHDSGVLGPQKSKKQKRQNAKSGANAHQREQRNTALQAIRDRFNPFEIKAPAKRVKFDATTRDGSRSELARVRPGVTKSKGEEKRRHTLLQEMNERNKVGGIFDRRFGENDPTMTPEERAAERFAKESQKKLRKESMFNLEDDEEEIQLTHMGQSLAFDDANQDDFEGDLGPDDDMSDSETSRKRKREVGDDVEPDEDMDNEEEEPGRKKSKHEVMKEVIAKSKFHKQERQMTREADDDLREELDKGLPDLFDMLRGSKPPPKPEPPKDDQASMNPERAALLEGKSREQVEKEYDQQLKQMTFDKRSAPTDRTKTEEEKVAEEAERLKELEEERARRMRGEESSDSEEDEGEPSEDESVPDDAKAFGLQQPTTETTTQTTTRPDMGVEDEDDFVIDDDLVETRSDVSLSVDESGGDDAMSSAEESEESEEEDEFINGLTLPENKSGDFSVAADGAQGTNQALAFTYPCPEDHKSFLEVINNVSVQDLPTVVQRIRALHHPRLHSDNKRKLGLFAAVLVQHVAYMADQPEHPPFVVLENTLRHVHSLAKSHPESVSQAFRGRLREMATERPLNLNSGDLVILTGIATTFPASDHFHAVVTPAHLCLARYLGQGALNTLSDFATGAYAASLCLQYQAVSKRYMPEFINYVLNALTPTSNVVQTGQSEELQFWDVKGPGSGQKAQEEFKVSLITTFTNLLDRACDLWAENSASFEIFDPAQKVVKHLRKSCKGKIPTSAQDSIQATLDKLDRHNTQCLHNRRPLLLHSHRPLAIKTAIPRFEEDFNPDKHYDPNRERAESNRLQKEYKRERKGAIRELRKDTHFVAREQLRDKRERDAEYEKKYRRLVSEVQNEEGRAANAYEREKAKRQGKS
ncbi:nucleolar complex protein 14 [Aspergillus sp. HF37]|nr:nucleolar complex protein 14 [Aspergillus sp. HF37]